MTETNNKLRALFFAVVMVTSVFAGTVALSGTVAAANDPDPADPDSFPRDTPDGTSPPQVIFVGEEGLDVSNVEQTDTAESTETGPIGDDSVTLVGLAGDADGTVETINPTDADFDGFATGTYDTNDDEQAEFSLREPEIEDVEINTQTAGDGADVTNSNIETGSEVWLFSDYNFDNADKLEVTIENPNGLDVTSQIIGNNNPDVFYDGEHYITQSGDAGNISLDFEDARTGTYNITVEGADFGPSETVSSSSRTVSWTVSEGPKSAPSTVML